MKRIALVSCLSSFVLSLSVLAANASEARHAADYAFLVRHQPEAHRGKVSEAYLRENVALAEEAREAAPWKAMLTDEVFREYVLPYTVIDEEVDRWRPVFREKFWPFVKDCKTAGEAAAILYPKIGKLLDVHYDVRRDKANQSPFHSMRIHMASCTGLAIIQIDVFRACGIPARFVGCNWTHAPGNHSWMEYYDGKAWHFFNDPDGDKIIPPDVSWFAGCAGLSDGSSPRTRIYATRWSSNAQNLRFWTTWKAYDGPSPIPADDVTASYRRFRTPNVAARLAVVARGPDGRRTPVPIRVVVSGSRKIVFDGLTYDESHDMNDHVIVEQPEGTKVFVFVKETDGSWRKADTVDFGARQKLCTLKVAR